MSVVTRITSYDDLPEWLSLREAAAYLGQSYWTVYMGVRCGNVPHRRFGKLYYVPKKWFAPATAHRKVVPMTEVWP